MEVTTADRVLDEMLDPIVQCFTPEVAERIAVLRADPKTQCRLDELAEKNTEGTLTKEEQALYSACVEAIDIIAILQAKARKALKP